MSQIINPTNTDKNLSIRRKSVREEVNCKRNDNTVYYLVNTRDVERDILYGDKYASFTLSFLPSAVNFFL